MKLDLLALLGATPLILAACAVEPVDSTGTSSQAMMGDGDMGGDHNCPGPAPIMQVGDFDGNGVVNAQDVDTLSAFKDSGDYAAFFDMNADGVLDGGDVSIVARNVGKPGTARDAQMAQLWATTQPYRNLAAAAAAGYVPFTPDLHGHGIHFANFSLILSWAARGGFDASKPEGLNYTADGRLVAAFYYAPAAVDLASLGYPFPAATFYKALDVPPSFAGIMPHEWHNHVGPCFGGATSPVPGFDQCMTLHECKGPGSVPFPASLGGAGPTGGVYGQLWSPKFHMLHVWLYEFNECGPFGGIDHDISMMAPEEPNHGACELQDVVPCVFMGVDHMGMPICMDGGGGMHH